MRIGQAYQRWLAGGAFVAAVLLAVGWFFLIGPQNDRTNSLHAKTTAAEAQVPTLRHRLQDLRAQDGNLAQYEAELARDRQALPATSGLSDFLRELQTSGDGKGVTVSGVIVGAPLQVTAAGAKYYALPITLTAEGGTDALGLFLDQLQQVQPRAVLINTAELAATENGGSLSGGAKLTVSLQVFVSAANDPPAAAPTTKPSSATKP